MTVAGLVARPARLRGDTLEEVEREMRAAIAFRLEGLVEDGEPIPEPSGPSSTSNAPQQSRKSVDDLEPSPDHLD